MGTRRRLGSLAPLALGLLLLPRCGSQSSLSGSLSEVFPLDVNAVTVSANSEAFQVSYLFSQAGNTDLVVQLTVGLAGLTLSPGSTVDLAGALPDGSPRTVVTHQLHGQPTLVLPAIQTGSLSLAAGGQSGQDTRGSFTLAFVNDGTVGALRTLSGSFEGTLASAAFPPDASVPTDGGLDGG